SPGYAPPEQLRGEHATAGPLGDVYSLGAILFELLALEPMHAEETVEALIASTLSRSAFRPSERAAELLIPPELDEICACATALRPEDRFESARELARALERFLDGERDAERRHELAERHGKMAVRALELAGRGGSERERMV